MDRWRRKMRTLRRISSGTFLTWSFTPRAPEWEKMTGAVVTLSASSMVNLGKGAMWETSYVDLDLIWYDLGMLDKDDDVVEPGDMCEVDHHPQPVHLLDDPLTKLGEPLTTFFISLFFAWPPWCIKWNLCGNKLRTTFLHLGRLCPRGVTTVCEGHVPGAHPKIKFIISIFFFSSSWSNLYRVLRMARLPPIAWPDSTPTRLAIRPGEQIQLALRFTKIFALINSHPPCQSPSLHLSSLSWSPEAKPFSISSAVVAQARSLG